MICIYIYIHYEIYIYVCVYIYVLTHICTGLTWLLRLLLSQVLIKSYLSMYDLGGPMH